MQMEETSEMHCEHATDKASTSKDTALSIFAIKKGKEEKIHTIYEEDKIC